MFADSHHFKEHLFNFTTQKKHFTFRLLTFDSSEIHILKCLGVTHVTANPVFDPLLQVLFFFIHSQPEHLT